MQVDDDAQSLEVLLDSVTRHVQQFVRANTQKHPSINLAFSQILLSSEMYLSLNMNIHFGAISKSSPEFKKAIRNRYDNLSLFHD